MHPGESIEKAVDELRLKVKELEALIVKPVEKAVAAEVKNVRNSEKENG